jgi:hypothetical protein
MTCTHGLSHTYQIEGSLFVSKREDHLVVHWLVGYHRGLVLGPILYLLYTAPLGEIMHRHGVSYHMYADDTQIDITFKSSVSEDMHQSRARIEACVRDIELWMLHNNLKFKQWQDRASSTALMQSYTLNLLSIPLRLGRSKLHPLIVHGILG